MNVPATAVNQRALRLLSLIQPETVKSTFQDRLQADLQQNYLETLFPTSVSGEPDASIRALNLQVHTDFFNTHGTTVLTGSSNLNTFWINMIWDDFYSDNEGNFTQSVTFIGISSVIQDKLLDGVALSTSEKDTLGLAIVSYVFNNMTDQSVWDPSLSAEDVGNNYRNHALDLNTTVIAWINFLDNLVGPIETSVFGGSCPTNSDSPDQPNSPSIASFTDVNVVVDIGISPCDHGSPITQYNIYRRPSGSGTFTLIGNTQTITNPQYLDSTVVAETAYDYQTSAVSAQGESARSTNISVTTLPDQGSGGNVPADLADFLDDIYGSISNTLAGIFGAITGLDNNKLFEMKMLEVLMAGTVDMEIGNLSKLATNQIELNKQSRLLASGLLPGEV